MFTTDLVNLYNRNIFKTSLYIYIFQDEKCRLMRNLSLSMGKSGIAIFVGRANWNNAYCSFKQCELEIRTGFGLSWTPSFDIQCMALILPGNDHHWIFKKDSQQWSSDFWCTSILKTQIQQKNKSKWSIFLDFRECSGSQ